MQTVREDNRIFPRLEPLWDDSLTASLAASSAPPPLKECFSGHRIVFVTGRENDGTGLYYYRARYYSPKMQRFLSEDPIEFLGGDVNLFAYVNNNPVLDIDPFGTTKGGKQNIFGDDPLLKDVSRKMSEAERKAKVEAIEEALEQGVMSKERAKALRAGLKVLKRGLRIGGLILLFLEEFTDPAEAGTDEDFLLEELGRRKEP